MAGHGAVSGHLWLDGLCQLLAELHAPLVVGVDVPDDALGEDLVLVHGDDGAQREGVHGVHHDGVGGSVTLVTQIIYHVSVYVCTCHGATQVAL